MIHSGWSTLILVVLLACSETFADEPDRVGTALNATSAPSAEAAQAKLQQKLTELEALQEEIKRLRAAAGVAPQQILIRVKMLEISRKNLERQGHDLGDGGVAELFSRLANAEPESGASPNGKAEKQPRPRAANVAILKPENDFKKLLQSWKKEGALVRVLCEPSIVTVSGRPASFRVGGEFPVVSPARGGKVKTDLRFFGTQMDAVPLLLSDGRVRLELRPRVSEIDDRRTIVVDGAKVPGLCIREIDTGIELRPGETLAASGFMQPEIRAEQGGQPAANGNQPPRQETDQVELLVLTSVELVDAFFAPTGD